MGNQISRQKKELHEVVENGDIKLVRRLLKKMKVDINRHDECENTVLTKACWKKNKEMVVLLLSKSADVNGTDMCGRTALTICTIVKSGEIVNLLLNVKDINVMKGDYKGMTAIHVAARLNHVTILVTLLSCPVSVDMTDKAGRTPLWYAARHCHVLCVAILLEHGASPQHESEREGSPLGIAKRRGHSDVVKMMEEVIRLRSHPYVTGVVAIRHQDQQKSEPEKMKEEIRQPSLVGKGRTTSAECQTLSQPAGTSVSEDECSEYVSRVVRAVQHVSSSRWYAIGSACGKTPDQLQQLRSFPDDSDKVQSLFDQLAQQMGRKGAADKLLEACNAIANPTYAAVLEEMKN